MHSLLRLLAATLAATALSACVSGPRAPTGAPYAAPAAGQPSAQLTIVPPYPLGYRNSEHLLRHDVQCAPDGRAASKLVSLSALYESKKPYAAKVLALPAGRSYFKYERIAAQATCPMNFSAELEAGHAYSLTTERNFKGILKGVECVVGMVDTTTGQPVQLDQESAYPDFGPMCRKQARDAAN